ncbi:hypothetical protein GCM10009001_03900 [Virgibacillus siamensis]|uniref:HTH luxR-type domain-containing protein n=1 Tax=Virgibacillus siamensis TaxID=480071 RepID=A0ABN1FHT2_9BACI
MISNSDLMEKAIELYAERFELTAIVTDQNAVPVHSVKGENELCNILFNQNRSSMAELMKEALHELDTVAEPILYEIIPGIHTLIAPVDSLTNDKHYLWAGLIIRDESRGWLRKHLEATIPGTYDWKRILDSAPVLTKGRKRLWMNWIKKLVHLSSLYEQEENNSPAYQIQSDLLQRVSGKDSLDIDELLWNFVADSNIFDFLGFAETHNKDEYVITHFAGCSPEVLLESTFSLGEGFLGRIPLSSKYSKWEKITSDPRAGIFHEHNLFPNALFGYPITKHDGTRAVLFGGKLEENQISAQELEIGHMLAAVLERSIVTSALKQENIKQLQRLSSLGEICRMMVQAPDLKSTLYIFVDIGLSILEGTFSSIILKDPESGKIKLISRGRHPDIKSFARNILKRYEGDTDRLNVSLKMHDDETSWEQPVIECPLYYKEELMGVLCIGTDITTELQLSKEMNFLQTLSIIGGITLFLASQDEYRAEQRQIHTLFRSIEQFDKERFHKAEEAVRVAAMFTERIGMNLLSKRVIEHGCMLASYDYSFIQEMLPESSVGAKMMECRELQAGERSWKAACQESRIIALILSYIDNGNVDNVEYLPEDPDELLDQFLRFIDDSTIVEEEIDPEEVTETAGMEDLKLSPRESDVLKLMMEGFSNREIAEKLYISGHTVKNHVTKVFQKLGVSDRAHAISKIYRMKYSQSKH